MRYNYESLLEAMAGVKAPCDHCPNRDECAQGYACSTYYNFVTAYQPVKPMRPVNRVPRRDIYRTIFESGDPSSDYQKRNFKRISKEEIMKSLEVAQEMLDDGCLTTELLQPWSTIVSRAKRMGVQMRTSRKRGGQPSDL